MVEICGTDEFIAWYTDLNDDERDSIALVVDQLEEKGLALGYPFSSAIKGSKHALRELRPKRGRSPLRVIYAFDPRRQAVLLIGGNKSGDKVFYERIVPKAEAIFDQYLEEQAAGKHDRR